MMFLQKIKDQVEGLRYDNTIEEEHYRKMRQKSSSNSAIIVGLVAAVGGFLYGYDTGLINDIMEMQYVKLEIPANQQNFSVHERAFITAILSLGTFVGALVAPLMSDSYGRKSSIIATASVIFSTGNILQVAATNSALLCAGRAVSGLAVGILSAIVPLYQAEASPKWVRGSIVFTYQWAITWGLLIASAICQGTRKINLSASYRIPIGVQFLWSLTLCTGVLFLPESPRYYVQKNNIQAALTSLCKLRRLPSDDHDLLEELVEIKANYDYEMSFGKTDVWDCFRLGGGRHKQGLRIITGIGVQLFQQCSGINFIFYYGVNFFASIGVINYYLMSFVTYLVNVAFTVPGIFFIDIIGRRKLLLLGGLGMSISNFIIAIVGVSISSKEIKGVVSIVFSCCFIACFASSWGGCTWAVCSDIFGISIRQKAVSITAATNWLVNFAFAYVTPYLIDTGSHTAALGNKIFFIWGSCNAAGVIFVYFIVYETKGLKLEEVDFMYQNCSNSRASTKFKSRRFYSNLGNNKDNIQAFASTQPDEWVFGYIQHDRHPSNSSSSHSAEGNVLRIILGTPGHNKEVQGSEKFDGGEKRESNQSREDDENDDSRENVLSPERNAKEPEKTRLDNVSIHIPSKNSMVKMVKHKILLLPSLSNTSDESESSSESTNSTSDYQRYLQTLQESSSNSGGNLLSSFTSTSILHGCCNTSRTIVNKRDEKGTSSQTQNGKSFSYTDLYPSNANHVSDSIQIGKSGNVKMVTVPFYNDAPNDSDSYE